MMQLNPQLDNHVKFQCFRFLSPLRFCRNSLIDPYQVSETERVGKPLLFVLFNSSTLSQLK